MATARPPQDAWQELREQSDALQVYCREFDAGKNHFAKHIAQSAYTLLFTNGRNILSVFDQVGFTAPPLLRTTCHYVPGMIQLPGTPLCMNRSVIHEDGRCEGYFVPLCADAPRLPTDRLVESTEWWDEIIYWSGYDGARNRTGTLTRGLLVRSFTDKDGGRHFEETPQDSAYRSIKKDVFPGVMRIVTGEPTGPLVDAHFATMRQIGHELGDSLGVIIAAGTPF